MEDELVAALEARQRAHPPVAGLAPAARVRSLRLFVGEARAAQVAALRLVCGRNAMAR